MIIQLQDKIAKYITRHALISDWRNIREYYARYSYLTFICLVANDINPDCNAENTGDILCDNHLENRDIIQYILETKSSTEFISEILEFIRKNPVRNINEFYQEFLARDFILKDNAVFFDRSKNNRDILGSYYTQEKFAYEITKKAIADYTKENDKSNLTIADYSSGGGAFLVSACKVCREKGIAPKIYGYDVDPIAVFITRFRLFKEAGLPSGDSRIFLGNPLLRNLDNKNTVSVFKYALSGRFYNIQMGIVSEKNMDIIIGNPPWEKTSVFSD